MKFDEFIKFHDIPIIHGNWAFSPISLDLFKNPWVIHENRPLGLFSVTLGHIYWLTQNIGSNSLVQLLVQYIFTGPISYWSHYWDL